ncbi:MAG: endo-1,4-beta-xylanase [Defluviitaleaceae bacterium]|nr:endo-1,4-beta-xylanase [Defluviitaleaceae bacterium]
MYLHSVKGRIAAALLALVMMFSLLPQVTFAARDPNNPLYWGNQPSLADAFSEYFHIGVGYYGTRAGQNIFDLPGVRPAVIRHYNALTAGNRHKPDVLLGPAANAWNWNWGPNWAGDADGIVNWAEETGMAMVGHTLVWHGQSRAWLTTQTTPQGVPLAGAPPLTREQAIYNMHRYISTVASRYRGQIYSWDVLNEVIWGADGGTWSANPNWRHFVRRGTGHHGDPHVPHGGFDPMSQSNSQWYAAFQNGANPAAGECGTDFVYYAFKFARMYDPFAVLYYNDYNDEAPGKRNAIAQMVTELNQRWAHDIVNNPEAVPVGQTYGGRLLIEGIGMQAHYSVWRWTAGGLLNPNFYGHVRAAIELYRNTGARISITELDIAINVTDAGAQFTGGATLGVDGIATPNQLNWQALRYAQLFRIWLENQDHIARVTFWSLNDYFCWIRQHQAKHVDRNWNIKPAWTAIMETLQTAPAPNISPPVINPATIPAARAREEYFGYQFTAQRTNFAPIRWSIVGGALPAGMRLHPVTGVLLGRPTVPGTFNFTVEAENARYTATRAFSIEVAPYLVNPLTSWADAVALGYIDISSVSAGNADTAYSNAGVTITNRTDIVQGIGINVAALQERFGDMPITVTATASAPPTDSGLGLAGSPAGSEWRGAAIDTTWIRDDAGLSAGRPAPWNVAPGWLRVLSNDGTSVTNPSSIVITLTQILIGGVCIFELGAPALQPVTIVDGGVGASGQGLYAQGVHVTISAGQRDEFLFDSWVFNPSVTMVGSNTVADSTTTFFMLADAVTATAQWVAVPSPSAMIVTVMGSHAAVSGSGQYDEGDIVVIHAGEREDYYFAGWTSSNPAVVFENVLSPTTTFIMPDVSVVVTANWTPKEIVLPSPPPGPTDEPTHEPSPEPTPQPGRVFIPEYFTAAPPAQSERRVPAVVGRITVAGGNTVNVHVTGERAIAQLGADTVRDIAEYDGDVVTFDVSNLDIISFSITRTAVRQLANADMGIEVALPQGVISLDEEAVAILAAQAHAHTITFRITEINEEQLPPQMAALLPAGAIVYQASISSASRPIRDFSDAVITVWLPYDGVPPVAVWRIGPGGRLILITGSVFDAATGLVRFTTSQLGLFVVGRP